KQKGSTEPATKRHASEVPQQTALITLGQEERADDRLDQLEALQQWEDIPTYSLQAMPPAGEALIPEVHTEDGPATVLGNPPSLRGAGFNLRVLRNKELVSGGVRFRNSQLAVWLEHDGFLTASSRADSTFLGWAINDHMGTG